MMITHTKRLVTKSLYGAAILLVIPNRKIVYVVHTLNVIQGGVFMSLDVVSKEVPTNAVLRSKIADLRATNHD